MRVWPRFRSCIFVTSFLAALATLIAANAARPCSICRCGDPTFTALGRSGYTEPGWRVALDWDRYDKDEGDPAVGVESQVENRATALVAWGLGERLLLVARVPYSSRELTSHSGGDAPETIRTHGFSDPELFGQVLLWGSPMGGLGRRETLALTAGLKSPWGENRVQVGGQRADEHAQPGTGATDLFASVAVLHIFDLRSSLFVSGGGRLTGTNDFGYRYGRALLVNAAYERKLAGRLDGVVELNFRRAGRDRLDATGATGDDTGGSLLYVTPRLLLDLGGGAVLRATVQVPTVRALNGHQTERAVPSLGLTRMF